MKFVLANTPVHIQWTFWIMGIVAGASAGEGWDRIAMWTGVVLVSILVHEMGHALAFHRFGHSPRVTMHWFGGTTFGSAGVVTSPMRDLLISLAGPAAGFLLGAMVAGIDALAGGGGPPMVRTLVSDLLFVNVGWGLYNLLPQYPLDGGLALSGGLRHFFPRRGHRAALWVSLATGATVALLAYLYGQRWVAYLSGWTAWRSYLALKQAGQRGDDAVHDDALAEGYRLLKEDRHLEVRTLVDATLPKLKARGAQQAWMELKAWSWLQEGQAEAACAVLDALPPGSKPDDRLLGWTLLKLPERAQEAAAPLGRAFTESPDPGLGRAYAQALVIAKDFETALGLAHLARATELDDQSYAILEAGAFYAEQYQAALELSTVRLQRHQNPSAAYNAACSAARLGQSELAVEWLDRAFGSGYSDLEQLATDEDLASIREHPQVRARLAARAAPAAEALDG